MRSFLARERRRPYFLAGGGGAVLLLVWGVVPSSKPPPNPHAELARVETLEQKKDVAGLTKAAGDQDPRVAARAVTALASVAPPEQARAALQQAAMDSRPAVRQGAASSWPLVPGGPSSPSMLVPSLKDTVADVRAAAVRSAGKALSLEVLPYLLAALDDPDRAVRQNAVHALEEFLSLKFGAQYSPDDAQPKRRSFVLRLTEFTNRPAVRKSLTDWHAELSRRHQQGKQR